MWPSGLQAVGATSATGEVLWSAHDGWWQRPPALSLGSWVLANRHMLIAFAGWVHAHTDAECWQYPPEGTITLGWLMLEAASCRPAWGSSGCRCGLTRGERAPTCGPGSWERRPVAHEGTTGLDFAGANHQHHPRDSGGKAGHTRGSIKERSCSEHPSPTAQTPRLQGVWVALPTAASPAAGQQQAGARAQRGRPKAPADPRAGRPGEKAVEHRFPPSGESTLKNEAKFKACSDTDADSPHGQAGRRGERAAAEEPGPGAQAGSCVISW